MEVDVAAPGGSLAEPIWSLATINNQGIELAPSLGTSMASPLVAGVAALALEKAPNLAPAELKSLLIEAGRPVTALNGKTVSEKVVDALKVLELLNGTPMP